MGLVSVITFMAIRFVSKRVHWGFYRVENQQKKLSCFCQEVIVYLCMWSFCFVLLFCFQILMEWPDSLAFISLE